MWSNIDETFRRMQWLSDGIRRDVERSLRRSFRTWDLLDYSLPVDPKSDYYRMKIRTDDNGHVKVKTIEKEPGKPEKIQVEEYDRGTKSLEQQKPTMITEGKEMEKEKGSEVSKLPAETKEVSEVAEFDKTFNQMQDMANRFRQQVESQLGRSFFTWDLMDYSLPIDPEKSYVRMKIKTDDNGHVRVKTAEKQPEKPWDVKVEEYDKGDKAMVIEQDKTKTGAISQGSESRQEQKKTIGGTKSAQQA